MFGKNVTKVIIVCDENTKEYANYLRQLISVNDDKDGEVIGTADGSTEAAVWLDKDYLANAATISSNEHILFIGNNKASKSEIAGMNVKFNMYGLKYGWLGKRAMMQVDDVMLNKAQYSEFIKFCSTYEQKFEKLVYTEPNNLNMNNKAETADLVKTETVEVFENEPTADKTKQGMILNVESAKIAAKTMAQILAVSAVICAGPIGLALGAGAIGAYKTSTHKKIRDQQYRALAVILYMDGLKTFLEG